jgi:FhuF 2Fe-2S C-terminal domain
VDAPGVLAGRVTRVRAALARGRSPDSVELRVAASITQLGVVARLIAPTIATAALTSGRATIVPDDCWWQDQLGGPFPLSIALREDDEPVDSIAGVIESITTITVAKYCVPARTAWGNVASAANSAAQMIGRSRPDSGPRAHNAADAILADARIEGGALHSGPAFLRSSCCLIYRLDNETSAVCGDCVLHRSPRHRLIGPR